MLTGLINAFLPMKPYKVVGMRQELLVTKFDYDENTGDYHLQGYRRRQQDREEETH